MAYVITEECLACGACIDECPSGAIQEGDIYSITEDCVECGACVDCCPTSAIQEK
jgi:formate hydrogenlyase subunit 6/NADH:ubiquinone oxidoreductase subunit I